MRIYLSSSLSGAETPEKKTLMKMKKNPGYGPLHSTSFRILLPYLHESILGGLEERKKSWRDVYCLSHLRDFFPSPLPAYVSKDRELSAIARLFFSFLPLSARAIRGRKDIAKTSLTSLSSLVSSLMPGDITLFLSTRALI